MEEGGGGGKEWKFNSTSFLGGTSSTLFRLQGRGSFAVQMKEKELTHIFSGKGRGPVHLVYRGVLRENGRGNVSGKRRVF